jgi:hypothetical protein
MSVIEQLVHRLEEALERQQNTEGEIASTPIVEYCFECDEIVVDGYLPDACLDHKTVSSDGYEHGGIQSAITALRYVDSDMEQCASCSRRATHEVQPPNPNRDDYKPVCKTCAGRLRPISADVRPITGGERDV